VKFTEAKKRLKGLAKGEYHNIEYSLTEYSDGKQKTQCRLYIGGKPFQNVTASTFEACFAQLENKLEETPDIEG